MKNRNTDDGEEKTKEKKICLPTILMLPLRTEYSSHYFVFKSPLSTDGSSDGSSDFWQMDHLWDHQMVHQMDH